MTRCLILILGLRIVVIRVLYRLIGMMYWMEFVIRQCIFMRKGRLVYSLLLLFIALIVEKSFLEPGNLGYLGAALALALQHRMPDMVSIQGVAYDASPIAYFEGGSAKGTRVMTQLIKETMKICPTSQSHLERI